MPNKFKLPTISTFACSALLLLLIVYGHTIAQPASFKPMLDKEAFLLKFKEVAGHTATLKSDFVQEKHLDFLTENSFTKGKLHYKQPDMVRLEYDEPLNYLLVFRNNKVLVKDKGKTKQFDTGSSKIFRHINNMIIGSINGDILSDKSFQVNYFENHTSFLIELVPLLKGVKEKISTLRVYINRKDYFVSRFEIMEGSGDYTRMQFMNQEMNTPISDETFIAK